MRGGLRFFLLTVFFFLAVFCFAKKVCASDDHLLINEIYPHEVESEGEWIELYNPTDATIDFSACTLQDETNPPQALSSGVDTLILKGQYRVFGNLSFGLNNDADEAALVCGGALIDDVKYGKTSTDTTRVKAPDAGKSLTRIGSIDTGNWAADFIMSLPTKGTAYQKPIFPTSVRVNEILPEPSSGVEEYIELYNLGVDPVDLSAWALRDAGGTKYIIPDQTILTATGFTVFKQSQTHIYLNNSGIEALYLDDPNGDLVSQVSYDGANLGQGYSYFSDGWRWTESPTPGAENIYSLSSSVNPQAGSVISIAEAKKRSIGDAVSVQGALTALPGSLGSQIFYLEDSSGGIQIYCYYKDFPGLSIGDIVRVSGEISSTGGELRIKIAKASDVTFISTAPPPAPKTIDPGSPSPEAVGQYVEATGTVEDPSGSTFYIRGKTGRIKVQIRNSNLVQKPKLRAGDQVQVKGILSIYNGAFRILPFEAESVKILKSGKTLPNSGAEYLIYPLLSLLTITLWKLQQILTKKLRHWPEIYQKKSHPVILSLSSEILAVEKQPLFKVWPNLLAWKRLLLAPPLLL